MKNTGERITALLFDYGSIQSIHQLENKAYMQTSYTKINEHLHTFAPREGLNKKGGSCNASFFLTSLRPIPP